MNFSDSIIAIFSMGWLLGMITLAMALVLWKGNDDADDKGQCEFDNDMRLYIPSRDRNRCGVERSDKQINKVSNESLSAIIRTMCATGIGSTNERDYLYEAADRLVHADEN